MADIGAALRAKLIGTTAVAAILGTRVYPDRLPQGATLPAAIYYLISGTDETSLAGTIGLAHARIQVDAWASTRLAANSLATAIRDAICAATVSRGTWDTVGVEACTPAGGGERYDTQDKGDGSDEPYYLTHRDYLVSYQG